MHFHYTNFVFVLLMFGCGAQSPGYDRDIARSAPMHHLSIVPDRGYVVQGMDAYDNPLRNQRCYYYVDLPADRTVLSATLRYEIEPGIYKSRSNGLILRSSDHHTRVLFILPRATNAFMILYLDAIRQVP